MNALMDLNPLSETESGALLSGDCNADMAIVLEKIRGEHGRSTYENAASVEQASAYTFCGDSETMYLGKEMPKIPVYFYGDIFIDGVSGVF